MLRACLSLLVALAAACAESTGGPSEPESNALEGQAVTLSLQLVAQGLVTPVFLTSPPRDPRLFVLEKGGRIRVIQDGVLVTLVEGRVARRGESADAAEAVTAG